MRVAIYCRVSTRDKQQNPDMQLQPMLKYAAAMEWDIAFQEIDKASADDIIGRVGWTKLIDKASRHEYDILLVWKLDRAFRSIGNASSTIKALDAYHIGFRSYMDPSIDTTNPNGLLVFNILASVAQFEKDLLITRVNEGIKYAQIHGTKSGKPIGRVKIGIPDLLIRQVFENCGNNFSKTARQLSIDFSMEVSPGFVSLRLKRALQTPPLKRAENQDCQIVKN